MADLIVTFGRAIGEPTLMVAKGRRTEKIEIAAAETDPVITTMVAKKSDTAADIYAEAACWYDIGPNPDAGDPDDTTYESSCFLAEGERAQVIIDYLDKVSVVSAA